jgi:hypothetical protein
MQPLCREWLEAGHPEPDPDQRGHSGSPRFGDTSCLGGRLGILRQQAPEPAI